MRVLTVRAAISRASSSEVETGSREENASKQESPPLESRSPDDEDEKNRRKKGCGLEGGPARYKTPTRGRLRRSADRTHGHFLVSKRCDNETHPRLDSRFSMSELGRVFLNTRVQSDMPSRHFLSLCPRPLQAPCRRGQL